MKYNFYIINAIVIIIILVQKNRIGNFDDFENCAVKNLIYLISLYKPTGI